MITAGKEQKKQELRVDEVYTSPERRNLDLDLLGSTLSPETMLLESPAFYKDYGGSQAELSTPGYLPQNISPHYNVGNNFATQTSLEPRNSHEEMSIENDGKESNEAPRMSMYQKQRFKMTQKQALRTKTPTTVNDILVSCNTEEERVAMFTALSKKVQNQKVVVPQRLFEIQCISDAYLTMTRGVLNKTPNQEDFQPDETSKTSNQPQMDQQQNNNQAAHKATVQEKQQIRQKMFEMPQNMTMPSDGNKQNQRKLSPQALEQIFKSSKRAPKQMNTEASQLWQAYSPTRNTSAQGFDDIQLTTAQLYQVYAQNISPIELMQKQIKKRRYQLTAENNEEDNRLQSVISNSITDDSFQNEDLDGEDSLQLQTKRKVTEIDILINIQNQRKGKTKGKQNDRTRKGTLLQGSLESHLLQLSGKNGSAGPISRQNVSQERRDRLDSVFTQGEQWNTRDVDLCQTINKESEKQEEIEPVSGFQSIKQNGQSKNAVKVPFRVPSQHSISRLSSIGHETQNSPLKIERFNPIYSQDTGTRCIKTNSVSTQPENKLTNLSLPPHEVPEDSILEQNASKNNTDDEDLSRGISTGRDKDQKDKDGDEGDIREEIQVDQNSQDQSPSNQSAKGQEEAIKTQENNGNVKYSSVQEPLIEKDLVSVSNNGPESLERDSIEGTGPKEQSINLDPIAKIEQVLQTGRASKLETKSQARKAHDANQARLQNFSPRTTQFQNDQLVYLQISPRCFNEQMITQEVKDSTTAKPGLRTKNKQTSLLNKLSGALSFLAKKHTDSHRLSTYKNMALSPTCPQQTSSDEEVEDPKSTTFAYDSQNIMVGKIVKQPHLKRNTKGPLSKQSKDQKKTKNTVNNALVQRDIFTGVGRVTIDEVTEQSSVEYMSTQQNHRSPPRKIARLDSTQSNNLPLDGRIVRTQSGTAASDSGAGVLKEIMETSQMMSQNNEIRTQNHSPNKFRDSIDNSPTILEKNQQKSRLTMKNDIQPRPVWQPNSFRHHTIALQPSITGQQSHDNKGFRIKQLKSNAPSKNKLNNKNLTISLHYQHSSQIDGESSYHDQMIQCLSPVIQTACLTPELPPAILQNLDGSRDHSPDRSPVNKQAADTSGFAKLHTLTIKEAEQTADALKLEIEEGLMTGTENATAQQRSCDYSPNKNFKAEEKPTLQTLVTVDSQKQCKNNADIEIEDQSAQLSRDDHGTSTHMVTQMTNDSGRKSSGDFKRQEFLRKIYTNMTVKTQSITKKKRPVQTSIQQFQNKLAQQSNSERKDEAAAAQDQVKDSYTRRTKLDNEWPFRIMNSRLQIFDDLSDQLPEPSVTLKSSKNNNDCDLTNKSLEQSLLTTSRQKNASPQYRCSTDDPIRVMSNVSALFSDRDESSLQQSKQRNQVSQLAQQDKVLSSILRYENMLEMKHSEDARPGTTAMDVNKHDVQRIQTTNPGSRAYLDHVRLKLKSQGTVGQRNQPRRHRLLSESVDEDSYSRRQDLTQSLDVTASQQKAACRQRRNQTLSVDLSVQHPARHDRASAGLTHSLKPADGAKQIVSSLNNFNHSRLIKSQATARRTAQTTQAGIKATYPRRRNIDTSMTRHSFAITQAKPTLFQPLTVKTVKVDSFAQASHVANLITKPGKPYETTRSLFQQKYQIHDDPPGHEFDLKVATTTRNDTNASILSFDGSRDEKILGSFAAQFRHCLNKNHEVSQQNTALRRKAFSFNQAMKKRDIQQIATNANELGKVPEASKISSKPNNQANTQNMRGQTSL